jgi:hypothetical protein
LASFEVNLIHLFTPNVLLFQAPVGPNRRSRLFFGFFGLFNSFCVFIRGAPALCRWCCVVLLVDWFTGRPPECEMINAISQPGLERIEHLLKVFGFWFDRCGTKSSLDLRPFFLLSLSIFDYEVN